MPCSHQRLELARMCCAETRTHKANKCSHSIQAPPRGLCRTWVVVVRKEQGGRAIPVGRHKGVPQAHLPWAAGQAVHGWLAGCKASVQLAHMSLLANGTPSLKACPSHPSWPAPHAPAGTVQALERTRLGWLATASHRATAASAELSSSAVGMTCRAGPRPAL